MGSPRAYTEVLTQDNEVYREWQASQPQLLTSTFGLPQRGSTPPTGRVFNYDGWRRTIISLGLFGEAWWLTLTRDRMGFPTMIQVLHPAFIDVQPIKSGPMAGNPQIFYGSGPDRRLLPMEDVTWVPFMAFPGAARGLSSIEYAGVAYALALAAMEYGQRWFAQGASPSYILSTEQKLGQEEVERIARKFLVEHSGLQAAHIPLVLDSGIKAEKITATPDEAQYLQTLEYARSCVAAWFGLPPHLVGGSKEAGTSWGKALALDTPIATPSGWTTMGDLSVGDYVFAADGKPTQVTFTSPVFLGNDCFQVEFNDGSSIIADADHLWQIETDSSPSEILTTREMVGQVTCRGYSSSHRIQLAGQLDLPDADLPIDPYVFGYWLGDGSKYAPAITTDKGDLAHLEAELIAAGFRVTSIKQQTSGALSVRFNYKDIAQGSHFGVGGAFTTLGVRENKHIPAIYLRASASQRLALLQGFMDSDGSAELATPRCEFANTNEALARGFYELAASLGLRPTFEVGRATLDGRDCGAKYRIRFYAVGLEPFRLSRKLERVLERKVSHQSSVRHIVSITPVESVPTRCIRVDNEDHLFLAGEAMVPTHNTIQEQAMQFVDFTMSGYIVPIQEALSSLLPSGLSAAFDDSYIQRADAGSLAQLITAKRAAGVETQNEVRVHDLHRRPMPGGDELIVPMNTNASGPAGTLLATEAGELDPKLAPAPLEPPPEPTEQKMARMEDNLRYLEEAVERLTR